MRSLGDVLSRSEERQNLKSGAVIIAALCLMIGLIFTVMNLEFDRRSENVGAEPPPQTALSDD